MENVTMAEIVLLQEPEVNNESKCVEEDKHEPSPKRMKLEKQEEKCAESEIKSGEGDKDSYEGGVNDAFDSKCVPENSSSSKLEASSVERDNPPSTVTEATATVTEDSGAGGEEGQDINLDAELRAVRKRIKEKEDRIRQLKLVNLYRKKGSTDDLAKLVLQWKEVAVSSFEDLYKRSHEEVESITRRGLMKYLGVDPSMIGLELEEDDE